MLKKIVRKLDIDFDIGNTLLLRIWSTVSGGLLVLMIPVFLSSAEQGYYFTFSSIIAMQVFFELGFNFVITQMISHEMVKVSLVNNKLVGNENSINRIYSLIRMLLKWYSVVSILFFIVVFFVGVHFFSVKGSLLRGDWIIAWTLITLFSAINLFVSPFFSVLEGIGLVGRVAQVRLFQSILGYSLLACLFLFHYKLNALPAISGSAALIGLGFLFHHYYPILFGPIKKIIHDEKISWRREIFPFQWRMALSWLSGYLIFQLFNPLIFANQGAIEAGRVGLSLAIFSTILTLSISWVNAKVPALSKLISAKNKKEINTLFANLLIKSTAANVFFSTSFIIMVCILKYYEFSLIERLVSIDILIMMAIITLVNHIIYCCATYMRAHKEEPMLFNSIVTGILVGLSVYFSSKVSVSVTILSYFSILFFICLPWTVVLFNKYYRKNKLF
ncbi:hypothetical protein [Leminorella grimontii]|uniref:hypothetical protein n=1 Tax=Leminorella grimontii TaxID=82981 RepID=UPI00321F671B